jgi:filamentous hemagglutinin
VDGTLKEQAKRAVNLRNEIRSKSRELMADRTEADKLNRDEPNMTWDQVVKKYQVQGYTGDNLWNKIIESSQKPRASVIESPPVSLTESWGLYRVSSRGISS